MLLGFWVKGENILILNCRVMLKLLVTLFHILISLDCTIKSMNSRYEKFYSHTFCLGFCGNSDCCIVTLQVALETKRNAT